MRELKSFDDLYPAIDELVSELRAHGESSISGKLDFLVHHVAWTTGTELLTELAGELQKLVEKSELPEVTRGHATRLRDYIFHVLRA